MVDELTKAELLVFDSVKSGLSNKGIGARLFICEKTVKFHLTNIYKKIGVKSKLELLALQLKNARYAQGEESGLTSMPTSDLTLPYGSAQRR